MHIITQSLLWREVWVMFGLASEFETWQLAAMAAISLTVGLTGGVVGIALGVIRLPMLTLDRKSVV